MIGQTPLNPWDSFVENATGTSVASRAGSWLILMAGCFFLLMLLNIVGVTYWVRMNNQPLKSPLRVTSSADGVITLEDGRAIEYWERDDQDSDRKVQTGELVDFRKRERSRRDDLCEAKSIHLRTRNADVCHPNCPGSDSGI